MSTLAELVLDVRTYPDESTTTLADALIEGFLNRAKRRMQRKHGWQGQQTSAPLVYPASAESIPLPEDFIAEYGLWLVQSTTRLAAIRRTQRRTWIEGNSGSNALVRDTVYPQTADPTITQPDLSYYLWGRALYIAPAFTADTNLLLDYYLRLPDLTGAQSDAFTDTYPDVLLAGALAEAYRYLHEYDTAMHFEQLFEARLGAAIIDDERLAGSGPPKTRGEK